jgi:glycerate-2-kinase
MKPEILERMRQDARDIFYEGLAAANPETCIHQCCSIQGPVLKIESKTYDLDRFTKILVLGAGKAGAIADGATAERARRLGLVPEHFLSENNAYPFFKSLSDLFKTGPTLTNVMDLHILLVR